MGLTTLPSKRKTYCYESRAKESWWQIEKNGRKLFDRPKPTVGCSANGIIIIIIIMIIICWMAKFLIFVAK